MDLIVENTNIEQHGYLGKYMFKCPKAFDDNIKCEGVILLSSLKVIDPTTYTEIQGIIEDITHPLFTCNVTDDRHAFQLLIAGDETNKFVECPTCSVSICKLCGKRWGSKECKCFEEIKNLIDEFTSCFNCPVCTKKAFNRIRDSIVTCMQRDCSSEFCLCHKNSPPCSDPHPSQEAISNAENQLKEILENYYGIRLSNGVTNAEWEKEITTLPEALRIWRKFH